MHSGLPQKSQILLDKIKSHVKSYFTWETLPDFPFLHFFSMVLVASQLAASPFFRVNDLVLMLVLGSHSLQAPLTYLQLSAANQKPI